MKQKFLLKTMLLLSALVVGSGNVWATDVLSWSRSGTTDTSTSGYTFGATASAKSGYYQDGSGTAGIKLYSTSSPICSSTPSSVTFTAHVGGGSGNKDLSSSVYVCYVDDEGNTIDGTETEVTGHITTNTGDDYEISMPTSYATDAYGVYIYHTKETGYNVRYYSFSLSYEAGGGSSDPSSAVAFTYSSRSLDLKDAASFTQTATTASGYSSTPGAVVTYSMTANTAGATINSSTGEVTPTKAGSVTVQASAAAVTGAFAASSATYTLTVTDTRVFTVTYHTGNTSTNVDRTSGATLSLDNPAAICGMDFVGWSSTDNPASPTWVANTTKVTGNMELYAMYEEVAGEYSYHLVESSQADWRGDYLIAYSSTIFADGRVGGTSGMGANGASVNPSTNLSGKVVAASWGDTYNVTIVAKDDSKLSDGYLMKTKDGKYNYQSSNANGLAATDTKATAANYPLSITYNSSSDIDIAISAGAVFHYNSADDGYFRFYKDGGQNNVYLYKRTEDVAPVYSLGLTATITLASACNDGAVTPTYYGTYSNSSSAFKVPSGLTVSEIYVDKGELTLFDYNEGDIVPANTGVLVSSTTSGDHSALLADGGLSLLEELGEENFLKPSGDAGITASAMTIADTKFYRLTMHGGTTLGFFWGAASGAAFDLGANKAYLAVPTGAGVKEFFTFDFGDDPDGINMVNGEGLKVNGPVFDLQGRRIEKPSKGLYIMNGKKVLF